MPKPLYQQIYNKLVLDIHNGKYVVGERFPSEKEILEAFGVSRITAIHVLKELEQAGFIERHRGSGNTLISVFGRSPLDEMQTSAPTAAKIIGLIIPFLVYQTAQPEHFQYMQGVNECLMQSEYRAVIYTRNDIFDERDLLLKAKADGCEGLICYPEVMPYIFDLLHRMAAEQYPYVLLDHSNPSLPVPVVGPDNRKGQKELVSHLIKKGHRKIAYYSFDGFTGEESNHQRYLGYDDALRQAGIEPSVDWVCILKSADCRGIDKIDNATPEQLEEYKWELLKKQLDAGCTAVCTFNDYEAVQLATLFQKKGVDLNKIAVTGFDGLSFTRNTPLPILSTQQDFHRIGYCAAKELLSVLENGNTGYRQILIPNKKIIG